jgi:hypothetical protein
MVMFTSFPLAPVAGRTLVIVGAGFVTVNPPTSVTTPVGPELETETSLAPVAAAREIVIYARTCVALTTVTESAAMPAPKPTVVVPGMKFVPLIKTMKA